MTSPSKRVHLSCERLAAVLVLIAFSSAPGLLAAERLPLQKSKVEIGQPAPMEKEFEGYDDQGKPVYWDPKPRVVALGRGKYAFKWTGRNGRQLTLIYLRPDAVDMIVEAGVTNLGSNPLEYQYELVNLATSDQSAGGFELQTFSMDIQPQTDHSTYATPNTLLRRPYPPEGAWMRFAPLNLANAIRPGVNGVFRLSSGDLPGLVRCRVHAGDLSMEGVGEEPPAVLEDLYLRRDAWPHGWTIGPDERMAKMSLEERLKYLVERLPKMLELGWIENQKVMGWYETNLKAGKAAEVRAR